jgi:glycosyltransferase involved in cell wall biosynthesis
VAVIIAAHNREQWVQRAVNSALAQRPHPPAEVIVVDDCSTDDTGAAARAAGATVIRHGRNLGAAAARNTGAGAATQPWIAPLDSDDRWLPHMLATVWPHRAGHGFVAAASLAVDGEGRALAYGGPASLDEVALSSPAPLVYPENFVSASGVIIDRELFNAVGRYSTKLRQAEDLDLWLRMLAVKPGLCVSRVVTLYQVHEAQKSRGGATSRQAVLEIIERYRDQQWCSAELIERRRAVMAWDALREAGAARDVREIVTQSRWLLSRAARVDAVRGALQRRRKMRQRAAEWAPRVARNGSTPSAP